MKPWVLKLKEQVKNDEVTNLIAFRCCLFFFLKYVSIDFQERKGMEPATKAWCMWLNQLSHTSSLLFYMQAIILFMRLTLCKQ